MPFEKAFLALADSPAGTAVPALFNPPDYTVTKTNHFAQIAIPGLEAQLVQFVRGENRTVQVELFFDTTEARGPVECVAGKEVESNEPGGKSFAAGTDVREVMSRLTRFMQIDPKTHTPPVCLFGWGRGHLIRCVIESATQKFTRFLESGTPVRGTLNLTLREVISASVETERPEEGGRGESVSTGRTWQVKEGDTLWAIAGKEYGDPRKWTRIARENGIENPRRVRIGTILVIPEA